MNVDFIDIYIVAVMEKQRTEGIYSFDRKHLKRFQNINRLEPWPKSKADESEGRERRVLCLCISWIFQFGASLTDRVKICEVESSPSEAVTVNA